MLPAVLGCVAAQGGAPNPFADWGWKYPHVIPADQIPSAISGMPVPIRSTVPGLHATGEVLKLPLRKSVSAYGRDDSGLFDYGDSTAKVSRVPHVLSKVGTPTTDDTATDFNGSDQALTIPYSVDFALGYTSVVEFEFNLDTLVPSEQYMVMINDAGDATAAAMFEVLANGTLEAGSNVGGGGPGNNKWILSASGTITSGVWYKVTLVRNSDTLRAYLNDVEFGTAITGLGTTAAQNASGTSYIGRRGYAPSPHWTNGKIRNVRIYKGVATAPVTFGYLPQDLYQYSPHKVLGLSLAGDVIDDSFGAAKAAPSTAHVVTLVGNAYVDATGLHLDGNGDYATSANSSDYDFPGLFRISLWVRFTVVGSAGLVVAHDSSGPGTLGWMVYYHAGNIRLYNGAGTDRGIAWTPDAATWYHIEIVRTVDALQIYVNDSSLGIIADGDFSSDGCPLFIGQGGESSYYLNGDIRDVVILKGSSEPLPATYTVDMQDVRVALGNTELAVSYPERGRDGYRGIVDAWTMTDLSDSADTTLTVYTGNADAVEPTEGVTWPSNIKAVYFRSGFIKDLTGNFDMISVSPSYITDSGIRCSGSAVAAKLPYSADAANTFTDISGKDFCTLVYWRPKAGERGVVFGIYPEGTYQDEFSCPEVFANQTLQHFYRDSSNPETYVYMAGSALTNDTLYQLGARRVGSNWATVRNGTWSANTVGFTGNIYRDSSTTLLAVGTDYHGNNEFPNGEVMAVIHFLDTTPTADETTVLDVAIRTPDAFNEIGALEENV